MKSKQERIQDQLRNAIKDKIKKKKKQESVVLLYHYG